DEVDSGIGGSVALSLADCICGLAKEKQVIAITHLATVASRASMHFVVTKNVVDGRTFSHLKCVDGEDRVHEIARMLSGDEGTLSVEHAKQLLQGNMQKQVQDL
ncbi:MAG: DNA repair protein RecN, partial [Sphaerochaetaceae bacterium]|nr:DNA repair protein RecN [Sphaerochaetaceae bacterium]